MEDVEGLTESPRREQQLGAVARPAEEQRHGVRQAVRAVGLAEVQSYQGRGDVIGDARPFGRVGGSVRVHGPEAGTVVEIVRPHDGIGIPVNVEDPARDRGEDAEVFARRGIVGRDRGRSFRTSAIATTAIATIAATMAYAAIFRFRIRRRCRNSCRSANP